MTDKATPHETHVCRDCGAEITLPYARQPAPFVPPPLPPPNPDLISMLDGPLKEVDPKEYARLDAARQPAPSEGLRAAEGGFARCPLCGDPERVEDIVGGVCLTCADAIAFAQNARRASIVMSFAALDTPRETSE